MNKKITAVILFAILFGSFGNVGAEEIKLDSALIDSGVNKDQIIDCGESQFDIKSDYVKGANILKIDNDTFGCFGKAFTSCEKAKIVIKNSNEEVLIIIDGENGDKCNVSEKMISTSVNDEKYLVNTSANCLLNKASSTVSDSANSVDNERSYFNDGFGVIFELEMAIQLSGSMNTGDCTGTMIDAIVENKKGLGDKKPKQELEKPRDESVSSEQVKCIFNGSDVEQKCYLSGDNDLFSCSGVGGCVMDVKGDKGNEMTWKSSCGGYGYTKIDGINDTVQFGCDIVSVDINEKSELLANDKFGDILTEIKQLRNIVKEQANKLKYLEKLGDKVQKISDKMESALNNFITYGVDINTQKLGEGERAAVISSYKSAYEKLPTTEAELADAIKIASGRWPSTTSNKAEKKAKEQFAKIYKRIADMNNANDNAAITIMAYGLRQKAEARNLNSETTGIKTFRNIYGKNPNTTDDWNAMQAITYSGASRQKDTDGDFLPDDREIKLGTNPSNKDSDGDGYVDGTEVDNGYNPLKK